jgi:hypothetical protein
MLASEAGDRGSGDQRPILVEREGDERQADRGGHAEQCQRCAAGPLE